MSNPTNNTQHSEYAPKRARQVAGQPGPGIAQGDLPSEDGRALSEYLRRLQPEVFEYREPPPRRLGRLGSIGGLVFASVIGAAIVVLLSDTSRWTRALGFGMTSVDTTSRLGDNRSDAASAAAPMSPQLAPGSVAAGGASEPISAAPPERAAESAALAVTPMGSQLSAATTTRTASLESTPAVQGVTDSEIRLGISAPLSGSAKELGNQMKLGIETAFALANDTGGLNGRQVKLVAADDGYEPTRTAGTMRQLYEQQQVFGFIGNVGTPTAVVALPYALEHHALFFGAFTGAGLLRRDPPDRYVFNYRASYAEETDAVVRYLVRVRHLRPEQIAVFAQHDAFGDAGFAGVAKATRALRGDEQAILRLDYERNTVNVDDAVARLSAHKNPIKAVVMVAAYRPAAKFIEKTRDLYPDMVYTNVSFVGSTSLADELMLLGPRFAKGVIVTQVVPAIDSYASAILKYKNALGKYQGDEAADYVSFEGYVDGSLLLEGLRRAGPEPDTEKLVDSLESIRNFDLGLGTLISFGPAEHQGSHKVWGTELNEQGHYEPIDLQ
ncbi:MAG TPA: ABC transporter substrate-binding protein [Xanthobacteraceae bacterium]|jgi:ABC-type branched-subunit amino acid transport system substrate-binding protein